MLRFLRRPTMREATIGMLFAAAVLSCGAWALQAAAAADLHRALEIQAQEVPDPGGGPPSLDEYEAVLTTLDSSIEIRRNVDSLLGEIEAAVGRLEGRQDASLDIVSEAVATLEAIARSLDPSVAAARSSRSHLTDLRGALAHSVRLARAIAEELEELDRKMGPSAGDGP